MLMSRPPGKLELQQGTASVLTGVGRICIPSMSHGAGAQAGSIGRDTPGSGRDVPGTIGRGDVDTGEQNDTLMLNSAQLEYLREILTVQQWHRLTALA